MNSYDKIYTLFTETGQGTPVRLKLTKEKKEAAFDPRKLSREKTTIEPLLSSGKVNPKYEAMINRFKGKLSPEVIASMQKRIAVK